MPCLFHHRWTYDFRLYHVYRRCQFCNATQRNVRHRGSADMEWETIRGRVTFEPERQRIVQEHSTGLHRLAHSLSLGLLPTGTSDRTRY